MEFNFYLALVVMVALQRLSELLLSGRNERQLKSIGAIEVESGHFIYMKIIHSLWLVACLVEAYLRLTPPPAWIASVFLLIFIAGQAMRLMAIKKLGIRWSVKIMVLPNHTPVNDGIFKYIRHPNYLGVILEIFALPLIYGSWITALVFSLLNALILKVRIKKEESALSEFSFYQEHFAHKNRFIPHLGTREI